jgi:hypothetical protein
VKQSLLATGVFQDNTVTHILSVRQRACACVPSATTRTLSR